MTKVRGSVLYRFARGVLRVALGFYFSRVEKFRTDRVPPTGPVLFTSNHPNSVTDAFVIGSSVKRKVNFVATVQMFRVRPLRWLLTRCGVIPINRVKDDPRAMRTVAETFEACYRVLESGEAVGIFPEGITYNDARLKEVKPGAARMALELEHRHGGKLGLAILPVGLTFSEAQTYRSEALVHFGEPIRVTEFLPGYMENRHEGIQALTHEIEESIRALILHVPRLERFRIVRAVRRLYQERLRVAGEVIEHSAPVQVEDIHLTHTIARVVDFVFEHRPERAAAFVAHLDHYERLLQRLHLSDEVLAALPHKRQRLAQSVGWALMAILAAPIAAYGWLHRWLPVSVIQWVGRRVQKSDPRTTSVSTTVIIAGIVAFILFYGAYVVVFHLFFGWRASLFYALTLPPAGLVAHYYVRELRRFGASLRATWVYLRAPAVTRRLLALRAQMISEIEVQRQEILGRVPGAERKMSV